MACDSIAEVPGNGNVQANVIAVADHDAHANIVEM